MTGHNSERICVVYFENKEGYVIVAPDHRHPTPEGFERRECKTLKDIDRLTVRLNRQDTRMFERMWYRDREQMIASHDKIRSKLRQRLLAIDCSKIERLFIESAFRYFERKEKEYENFKVRGYFQQREFDSKNAKVDDYGKQLVMPKLSSRLASALSQE